MTMRVGFVSMVCSALIADAVFTDVEGNTCLATVGGGSFSVKSIADSSRTSIPWSGAPPFALSGSLLNSLALPDVSTAAITIANRSESNRGWSVSYG